MRISDSLIRFLKNGKNADKYYNRILSKEDEILYANRFHDVVKGSSWFPETFSVCPGVGSAGYNLLYCLFRILDEAKSKHILELGMGQTTKMIGQYSLHHKTDDFYHIVVEHDEGFIDFCRRWYPLDDARICHMELMEEEYPAGGKTKTYRYRNFSDNLKKDRFDLIVVDGPYGYNRPEYSRVDILDILPDCLEQEFCLVFDDCNRIGEQNTLKKVRSILEESGIVFFETRINGETEVCLITSEKNRFLTYT